MSKRICLYCRHYHHKEDVYDGLKEVMPGVCVPKMKTIEAHCDTYPDRCKDWWKKNGNVTPDNAEEMNCFEFTEDGKMLNDLIEDAKELLSEIKKDKPE